MERDEVIRRYRLVRERTAALAAPLSAEDMLVQSMPDASPTKWHRAHTTWFFEEFVLARSCRATAGTTTADLFNSYYEGVGPRDPRAARGLVRAPGRRDRASGPRSTSHAGRPRRRGRGAESLGLHHEQQHQELLLTDIKHALGAKPAPPASTRPTRAATVDSSRPSMDGFHDGGVGGSATTAPFASTTRGRATACWSSRSPSGSRLVTNGEYTRSSRTAATTAPSSGSPTVGGGWRQAGSPLYWGADGDWEVSPCTDSGPLTRGEPVIHVSYYEADAYARWTGAGCPPKPNGRSPPGRAGPATSSTTAGSAQPPPLTSRAAPDAGPSSSSAPPGLDRQRLPALSPLPPGPGALGEYNGKFMSGQMVSSRRVEPLPARSPAADVPELFSAPHPLARGAAGIRLASD